MNQETQQLQVEPTMSIGRRGLLKFGLLAGGALLVETCGSDTTPSQPTSEVSPLASGHSVN